MGRELINRITKKKSGVYLSTHSSNDDAPFHSVHIKFLSDIYDTKGQKGLDKEIIKMLHEYASLRGQHHSLQKYYYALNSPVNDKIYKEYINKINDYYNTLTEEDKKTLWSSNKTDRANKYHEYENYMRDEMYGKMAIKCTEYDLIMDRLKDTRGSDLYKFNYYKNLISKVLDVSEEYGVDFDTKIPFQDFGSDDETAYGVMSSFSNYYKDILKELNINVDNISTDNWSDGKYIITINDKDTFETYAWESINGVIDNIESMKEQIKIKEGDISYE